MSENERDRGEMMMVVKIKAKREGEKERRKTRATEMSSSIMLFDAKKTYSLKNTGNSNEKVKDLFSTRKDKRKKDGDQRQARSSARTNGQRGSRKAK